MPINTDHLADAAARFALTNPSSEARVDTRDTLNAEFSKIKTTPVPQQLLGSVNNKPVVVTPMQMERLELGLKIAQVTRKLIPHPGNQMASVKMTGGMNRLVPRYVRHVAAMAARLQSRADQGGPRQRESLISAKAAGYLGGEICYGIATLSAEIANSMGIPAAIYTAQGHTFSVLYPEDRKEDQVVIDGQSAVATVCPASEYRFPFTSADKKPVQQQPDPQGSTLDLNQIVEMRDQTKEILDQLPGQLLENGRQAINKKIDEREKTIARLRSDPGSTQESLERWVQQFNALHTLPAKKLETPEEARLDLVRKAATETLLEPNQSCDERISVETITKSANQKNNMNAERRAQNQAIMRVRHVARTEATEAAIKAALESGRFATREITKTATVVAEEGDAEVSVTLTAKASASAQPGVWRTPYNADATTYQVEGGAPKNFAVVPEELLEGLQTALEEEKNAGGPPSSANN